jgi:hypothetical protein
MNFDLHWPTIILMQRTPHCRGNYSPRRATIRQERARLVKIPRRTHLTVKPHKGTEIAIGVWGLDFGAFETTFVQPWWRLPSVVVWSKYANRLSPDCVIRDLHIFYWSLANFVNRLN